MDDCTGEQLGYCLELLFQAGCRDAFFTPIYMKKNRPAYLLQVLCDAQQEQAMTQLIFKNTTTIGLRRQEMDRVVMERKLVTLDTSYGSLEVKRCWYGELQKDYVEYESAKRLAAQCAVSLDDVYREAYLKLNENRE